MQNKSIEEIYLDIYNDKGIREIYNKINYLEENKYNGYAHHDFTHVCNVKTMAEKLKLHYIVYLNDDIWNEIF